jgi:hypothetical protein
MKRGRFTTEQVIVILKEQKGRAKTSELARYGIGSCLPP